MVTVQEAVNIVLKNCYSPVPEQEPITEAVGRIVSQEILADRDFPPFNRVAMDGIAINYQEWQTGRREFLIEDIQAAGEEQKRLRKSENCLEVMTGSVLPEDTDTVIRYEDVQIQSNVAKVIVNDIQKSQNIHPQGKDARQDDVLLMPGTVLSPAEVALLATVGVSKVDVLSLPKAAIVSTGDELVSIDETPEPYQIRRSNTYAIQAAMKQMGWTGTQFHVPDHKDFLRESLETIIASHDVVILTGGVSKGKFDFIPDVLTDLGVKKLFHEVSQRPGKPFWFGVTSKGKVIFALPGNPVSTFMCFFRYIRPWLEKSLGMSPGIVKAVLGEDLTFEPRLTYFLQVQVINEEGRLVAYPRAGGGSGDFANLKTVDGFLELPPEKSVFKAGDVYPLIPFRR